MSRGPGPRTACPLGCLPQAWVLTCSSSFCKGRKALQTAGVPAPQERPAAALCPPPLPLPARACACAVFPGVVSFASFAYVMRELRRMITSALKEANTNHARAW